MEALEVAVAVRRGLRTNGCLRWYRRGADIVSTDVAFAMMKSRAGNKAFAIFQRSELPAQFGYGAFRRTRHAIEVEVGRPVAIFPCRGMIVIAVDLTPMVVSADASARDGAVS